MKDEEFLIIARALKKFYKEQITEQEFIDIINSTSAEYVETILPDPNKLKLLADTERIRSGKYTVIDVKGFMISYNDEPWHIYMGRDIIETLANDGDEEEIERLSKVEAYEESLRRGAKSMPPMPNSLSGSKSYLDSMDSYYHDRQEFIEKRQKEICAEKKKDIFGRKKR
jgi:hypothetical protein